MRFQLALLLILTHILLSAQNIEPRTVEATQLADTVVDNIMVVESEEILSFDDSQPISDQLASLGDTSHKISIAEFAVPAGVFATSALFVRTPALVRAREYVQKHVSHHGKDKIKADDYIQYAPMVAAYAMPLCGYKGQHNLIDRTILLAMSYATFAVLNNAAKYSFREQRPDATTRNSFPSGHTGTAFVGAEYMRREYWDRNKWVAMSGYAVGIAVAYLRIHNNRHWINDVVGGAALGYLSTTFAYWLYPRILKKRALRHRDSLLEQSLSAYPSSSKKLLWTAAPFAADGAYGLAASLTF